jgi:uncharacterized glyoxalase superfamily protein PhnB
VISNRSVPADIILPHVVYQNVAEAIAWLSKTFGFSEHYRYGDSRDPSGAQVNLGKAWFMLYKAKEGRATPGHLGASTQSLTVFVEDVDAHFERAKTAGVQILEEPHETVYGEYQYAAKDLAGHHWLFSRHAHDLNPADWGAHVSKGFKLASATSLSPMLSVRKGGKAIDFYKAAFGTEVLFRLDGEGGEIVAELAVGASQFWVADESPKHKNFSPESLGGSTKRLVLVVDDPDAIFERALKAGATTVWPVEDQPYEWRVGRAVDPFGPHWEIGKPLNRSKA